MPAQARPGDFRKFTQAQHHAVLALVDDVKTAGKPDTGDQCDQHYGTAAYLSGRHRRAGVAARRPFAATAFAEQAAEFFLNVTPHFIQIGRPLVAAGLFTPLRIVDRHQRIQHARGTVP